MKEIRRRFWNETQKNINDSLGDYRSSFIFGDVWNIIYERVIDDVRNNVSEQITWTIFGEIVTHEQNAD